MVLNCEDPTFLWEKENGLSLGHYPQVRIRTMAVGRPYSLPPPRGSRKAPDSTPGLQKLRTPGSP